MSPRTPLLTRTALLASGLLALAALSAPAQGDKKLVLPDGGEESFNKEYSSVRSLLNKLVKGEETFDAKEPKHAQAVDAAAKKATYRYTWPTLRAPGKVDDIYEEFGREVTQLQKRNPPSPELLKAYTEKVMQRAFEVMGTSEPLPRVNAARTLAKLAELRQPEMADVLAQLLRQELERDALAATGKASVQRNDGVKYYLCRAIRELLTVPAATPGTVATPNVPRASQEKLAAALTQMIEVKGPAAGVAPEDQVEGYSSMRKEAIQALARLRVPALSAEVRPGVVLLRVLDKEGGGLQPAPRIDERLEAAIGLADLRPGEADTDFQPDYAAYLAGRYLADLYQYAIDQKRTGGKIDLRPTRVYAAKLKASLDLMKLQVKSPYVEKAAAAYDPHLARLEAGLQTTLDDNTRVETLRSWLDANPPPGDARLLKSVPESALKPPKEK